MNSYIPSAKAIRMLNYFQTVGWHNCNSLYHQVYRKGIEGGFLLFTVGGKGIIRFDNKLHTLSAGMAVLLPPKTPMEYFTSDSSGWEFYWINLYGIYAIQTISYILENHDPIFSINNLTDCLEKIKQLIFLRNENKFQFELEVSQLIYQLLYEIIKGLFFSSKVSHSDSFLIKVVSYIEKHYNEPINIERLSKKFHISQNHLIRTFKSEIGYTPYEHLKKYRLLKASELLEMTDYSIKEISSLTGFPSYSNFIYQFKTQYGVTPCTYRKLFCATYNK